MTPRWLGPLVLTATVLAQPAAHTFAGTWAADLSRSKQNMEMPLRSVVIEVSIAGDTVSIADHHVYASGKEQKGTHTFLADGEERPFDAPALGTGVTLVATWTKPNVLDTVVSKDGKEVSRVIYEVSADGKTMTATRTGAYAQSVVFDRR